MTADPDLPAPPDIPDLPEPSDLPEFPEFRPHRVAVLALDGLLPFELGIPHRRGART
ncbi:hypothetical protein ACJ6WF_18020 [Streptomyces sp. MMS24-I2-30]|uniref:hypothetical protein n=1 Tax=Streptomyces sp. MMS24-I2-30 TaxID=3351564 RepID=UPI0038968E3D